MPATNPLRNGHIRPADALAIAEAAERLRSGGIVAIPTETVYGLAADASSASAVAQIYAAKGRPDFNPLIVHVSDREAAEALADFNADAVRLADTFWPGALTLVLPLRDGAKVAGAVTAGLPSIAIRCPAHPVMRSVLLASGLNLAAPSANTSGGISPTRAAHVAASLGDSIPLILDGGPSREGLESTIVALRETGWELLRPGPVTADEIQSLLASAALQSVDSKIEAPGQLASHYAPVKPLRLNATEAGEDEWFIGFGALRGDDNLSPSANLAEAAAHLFDSLHRADASDRASIAVAPIPTEGIGVAIADRLQRAAMR